LAKVYDRTLQALAKLPSDYYYRRTLEGTLRGRLAVLSETPATAETVFGEGLLEELVEQAQQELHLVSLMAEWRPWEPLEHPPPAGQWDSS
jgi:NADH dehydrogenase (ubiquinone) 1 alpha subcomplex subunit 5